MDSLFPHRKPLLSSQLWTSSLGNRSSRQLFIAGRNKQVNGVSQLRRTDDVDGDKSNDDELPLLQKLFSPAIQALRKTLFKRILPWSFLQPTPIQTPTPTNRVKVNNDTTYIPGTFALMRLKEPVILLRMISSRSVSGSSVERKLVDGSVGDGRHVGRRNSQENLIVVVDNNDNDPTDRPNHTSHHMTVDNPEIEGENTDGNAGAAAHVGEVVANPDLGGATMLQCDNRLAIATFFFTSPKIPKSDNEATLDEEKQFHSSVQRDSIASPSGKRSRSRSRLDRIDGRSSHWVFDVFTEDDDRTAEDGSLVLKRVRSSSRPLEATKTRPSPAVAVAVKDVQMSSSAHGDQEYEIHQIIGESGSGYEVTAFTKIWLPKASVDPKLVRKYRAEQRAATRIRTRCSSRLQNKN